MNIMAEIFQIHSSHFPIPRRFPIFTVHCNCKQAMTLQTCSSNEEKICSKMNKDFAC